MIRRRALGLAFSSTLLLAAPLASAQPSANLRGFRVSTDPNAGMYVEPADSPGTGEWNAGLWTSYSYRPVTLDDHTSGTSYHVISHQLTADLVGGVGLFHRVFVGVDLPFALYQTGDALSPAVVAATGDLTVPRQALGDLAIDVKTTLVRPTAGDLGGFAFALTERLTLPTGDEQSFLGEGTPSSETRFLGEFRAVGVSVHAALGVMFRGDKAPFACALFTDPQHPDACPTRFDHELPFALGVAVKPQMFGVDSKGRFTLLAELHGYVPLAPVHPFQSQALSELQASLAARASFGDVSVLAGVEHALLKGVGNPDVRAVLSVGWAPRVHDRDGDGIPDDVDQCPDLAEDFDGFQDADGCPDGDNDDDGIPDAEDACPNVPGKEDPDPKKNGCPPDMKATQKVAGPIPAVADRDTDGDGIPDKLDACPDVPGPRSTDPKQNGCPDPDKDHDTFVGIEDKCPDQAEDFNGFEDTDGCPDGDKKEAKRFKPLVVVRESAGAGGAHPKAGAGAPPPRWTLELAPKIGFDAAGSVEAASRNAARAVAAEVAKRPTWVVLVGVRPKTNEPLEAAKARAAQVAALIVTWARRPGAAVVADWAAVKATPRAEEHGIGFAVTETVATGATASVPAPPKPAGGK